MSIPPSMSPILDDIAQRLDSLDAEARRLGAVVTREVDPLVRLLVERYSASLPLASQIAVALVREGRRTGIDSRLLLAVLLVENPWLDTEARSFAGAIGLMQVMPFHAGAWGCLGSDLTDLDANICHGASILSHTLRRSDGDLDMALLLYNGCVVGVSKSDCHRYPEWVRGKLAYHGGLAAPAV